MGNTTNSNEVASAAKRHAGLVYDSIDRNFNIKKRVNNFQLHLVILALRTETVSPDPARFRSYSNLSDAHLQDDGEGLPDLREYCLYS